jgi:signal transduction histidine kinase
VPVSPEYTSKRLRIDMYPVYFPANRITRPILLGSALQIQLYNYSVMRSDTIGYVLAAIGGVILFFGIYYFSKNRKDRSLLVLGGLYMMLAGKLCAQSCLSASLFSDPYTSFYIFWISLLGTPLFVTLLLYRSYGSGMQRFFHIIIYAQILFMLTALILILLDIEFYAVLLTVFYILVTGFMVALFVRIRILSKVKKLSGATTTYLIMLFGLFLVDISNHYFQYIPVEFLSYNTLWLTSTAFYFTYHIIASKVRAAYARENEYQAMLLKSESLLHSYTQIDEYNTKIEKMRHDMWKHLSVLDALLEDGCVRSALEYLEKLLKNADARSLAIASPNHIINAIIQHNIERAKRANVNFTFDVRLPEYFNVEDVDLCSVFANCLDNALDACEIFNGKRFVHLASYIKNGHLYLRLENSARKCDQSKHRSHHGWGLKIVRDVVEKYDGIMQISPADNGVFIIEIALRLPMEAGSNCQEEAASAALPQ